jgi:sulfatase modifying factor 1
VRAVALLAGVALAGGACAQGPAAVHAPQVLLYVDTDAPLPGGPAGSPPALFDRVRIDLLPPGQDTPSCSGCTNEFELTTDDLSSLDASVGLAPAVGVSGYRARVRLFVTAFASVAGEPDPDSTIDTTVALPPTAEDDVTSVTVMLATDAVGSPVGTPDTPVAATAGAPTSSAVGTWAGAAAVPCANQGIPGEVCIPGGAFWLGTTVAELPHSVTAQALHPRLVTLSPFWLDDREVTVAAYRKFSTGRPDPWTGSKAGASWQDWCTFTVAPGPMEDHPLNCIRWTDARAYCSSIGADLPTEAQLEYVSGALQDQRFVWGEEDPACGDAVYGGGGGTMYWSFYATVCSPAAPTQAPLPVGASGHGRDRLALSDGSVVYDLAGNVAEWSRDWWNAPDETCWATPGVYTDPWCHTDSPSQGTLRTVRGGGWLDSGDLLLATSRYGEGGLALGSAVAEGEEPALGFRCARAD